jgi:hypothetical protein
LSSEELSGRKIARVKNCPGEEFSALIKKNLSEEFIVRAKNCPAKHCPAKNFEIIKNLKF